MRAREGALACAGVLAAGAAASPADSWVRARACRGNNSNGDWYKGGYKDGKRHGEGEGQDTTDGGLDNTYRHVYVGKFKDGKYAGQGTQRCVCHGASAPCCAARFAACGVRVRARAPCPCKPACAGERPLCLCRRRRGLRPGHSVGPCCPATPCPCANHARRLTRLARTRRAGI